mmetsp:Transcript_89933/g.238924  ORF Transcript_89933/g.238924 Transcript_89933/m.238924 type:complete len:209 (+) Transcript_89933:1025-1651(+)
MSLGRGRSGRSEAKGESARSRHLSGAARRLLAGLARCEPSANGRPHVPSTRSRRGADHHGRLLGDAHHLLRHLLRHLQGRHLLQRWRKIRLLRLRQAGDPSLDGREARPHGRLVRGRRAELARRGRHHRPRELRSVRARGNACSLGCHRRRRQGWRRCSLLLGLNGRACRGLFPVCPVVIHLQRGRASVRCSPSRPVSFSGSHRRTRR